MAMKLHNERFSILTTVEENPTLDRFDVVHNTENTDLSDFCMARVFHIERNDGRAMTVALVDLICSSYEPHAVLDGSVLTVILYHAIIRIHLDTGSIIQYEKCDNMGGLYEIHPIADGYILWGEGDIFRYDRNLNCVWHFTGRDIHISLTNARHFRLENDRIHCRDFEGWHYVLDFDGKLIDIFREVSDNETLYD